MNPTSVAALNAESSTGNAGGRERTGPEHEHHTDFTPVEPLCDDCLLTDPASR